MVLSYSSHKNFNPSKFGHLFKSNLEFRPIISSSANHTEPEKLYQMNRKLKLENLKSNHFIVLEIQALWHQNDLSTNFRSWFVVDFLIQTDTLTARKTCLQLSQWVKYLRYIININNSQEISDLRSDDEVSELSNFQRYQSVDDERYCSKNKNRYSNIFYVCNICDLAHQIHLVSLY